MKRTVWTIIIILVILVLFFGGRAIRMYVDWLWFGEVGFKSIFVTAIVTKLLVGLVFGAAFFAIVYGNVWIARRYAKDLPQLFFADDDLRARAGLIARRGLGILLVVVTLIIALMVAGEAGGRWLDYLKFSNAESFGQTDPVFGKDLSFFVFKLSFIKYVQGWLLFTLIMSAIAVAVIHYLDKAIDVVSGYPRFAPHVLGHLSVLLGFIFLAWAWGYYLRRYDLLLSSSEALYGAGYTDVHARLPALWVMTFASIVLAVLFFVNSRIRGIRLPIVGIAGLIVLSLFVNGIWPAALQALRVRPSEVELERPYIERHIRLTRVGYGLDRIEEKGFSASFDLTASDVASDSPTIENIRLWDYTQLTKSYRQLQIIRQYYQFVGSADVDRYMIGDNYRQVLFSARELSIEGLGRSANLWVNRHVVYTHGVGLCMSPANRVTSQGLPDFIVKDIPPVSSVGLDVNNPRVYYGEAELEDVLVKTTEQEFDYPEIAAGGEQGNVYTTYQGDAGIPISSFWRKLLFSVHLTDINFLFTKFIDADSKILIRRNIRERVGKIAPFLRFDKDPYLVIADGGLVWIQDAYTTAQRLPYSDPAEGEDFNYIRNSVKVTIDAYSGKTTFYVADPDDPVIRVYQRVFEGAFRPMDDMPESLRPHIRYPVDLFNIQAYKFARFHMRDPKMFFGKEDQWAIAQQDQGGRLVDMVPYYVIMRLPGEEKEEFILMLPFTPYNTPGVAEEQKRNNIISWMCARCDGADYGTLLAYRFPKREIVYGPRMIDARIDQDERISEQFTLWGQSGSQVARGTLLVIPIKDSLIYVQPVYLVAESGSEIPELKRVIVAYGDEIAFESTLEKSLMALFGEGAARAPGPVVVEPEVPEVGVGAQPPPAQAPRPAMQRLIEKAAGHYDAAVNAQRSGDWAAYGREIEALGKTLEELEEVSQGD